MYIKYHSRSQKEYKRNKSTSKALLRLYEPKIYQKIDNRFSRLFILEIQEGDILVLERICHEYHINDNGVFINAPQFHIF
ncbi:MAG: hypothetical protein K5906_04090 [Bacilli bacterium]|nr:hypothetical protein [Bacilli bacterium]